MRRKTGRQGEAEGAPERVNNQRIWGYSITICAVVADTITISMYVRVRVFSAHSSL